ncbi:MAG: zinc ABC transporter substrate-binding protein [Zetaproteobacteria bacterium CG12_big_fil_rev_8_21_14_0_65_55_1124]|nr:MAG: zinc ABC transporter substrate-binding protein [Zetaproteobacteria bacterium CG08_land_8_20_14_0_20_55_17]PIW43523.1 MAG: zinc ABC transporter substrate-binding protein [Zetaproteobacteria bacterium CG12_big_fil_rev_8_21_14_0_65_55_1124]PIY54138.1 MAG: zinc ABC transporter substrate-binding protein [Zetaproteobacteria bacterium CG_4_10_14_0_8_um_filter_55_43]PIZ39133.1 MAG: zinc ABC transporter substrate-binding protein [Zetaproteobacteria bacterium CG_4_10_14_0_2_um_filter_55_20]PJB815
MKEITMKSLLAVTLLVTSLFASAMPAHAAMRVFACEPEWAALLMELGGKDVDIHTATSAMQDPHHIQARPSLIASMRRADLVVATGAQLEIGWLPVLLRQSANPAIQPGKPGYFEAASFVRMLEVPASVDRIQGDVHPAGNPHIHTDPRNILLVAGALNERLQQLDVAHADAYQRRYKDFSGRWQAALQRWQAEASPLHGVKLIAYHKGWAYMLDWLGLDEVATIESVSGVPPGAAHLADLLARQKVDPALMVIYAAYQDGKASEWLGSKAGIPVVKLPFTVGGSDQAGNLFALYDDTLQLLLRAAGR